MFIFSFSDISQDMNIKDSIPRVSFKHWFLKYFFFIHNYNINYKINQILHLTY